MKLTWNRLKKIKYIFIPKKESEEEFSARIEKESKRMLQILWHDLQDTRRLNLSKTSGVVYVTASVIAGVKNPKVLEEVESISDKYQTKSNQIQPQIILLNQSQSIKATISRNEVEAKSEISTDTIAVTAIWSLPTENISSLSKEHKAFIINTIEYALSKGHISSFIIPIVNQTIKEIYITLPLNKEELKLLDKIGEWSVYFWETTAEYHWWRTVKWEKSIKFRIDKQPYMIT